MLQRIRAFLLSCAMLGIGTGSALGYYHFVHYPSAGGPYDPVVEKFDLNSLIDQTVYFHVSSEPPKLAPNDSFEALISQIRQALKVWNSVPTSALRVAYGGVSHPLAESQSPAGEIVFAELPPGVIGLGGPVTRGEGEGGFVPIVRSQVILSNDFTAGGRLRPSHSELFFTSLVHEIGHALGLQHTLTSSAMSTDVTRAATRAAPLGPDDVAGLSVLYPSADFAATFGSISGRVSSASGGPVSLASVVAVSEGGMAVSALTDPDGAYRIDGLLPGAYLLYVHPLPPATQEGLGPANIVLPADGAGQPLPPSGPFKTIFHGGSNRPEQTAPLEVSASSTIEGVDFFVEPTESLPIYNVTTFSFPGNGAAGVHPAFLDVTSPTGFLLATGAGLTNNLGRVRVEILGGDVEAGRPRPYELDPRFARIDVAFSPFTSLTPKHLIFRLDDDIYLLPSGLRVTSQPAPVIHWVAPAVDVAGSSLWSVRGANFDPLSAVYFDGWPAQVAGFDPETGELFVEPPPGPNEHRAVVTVYNPDGQSSAFTLPDGNVLFAYPPGAEEALSVSPNFGEADSDLVLEITGFHTHFAPGETVVGFGAADVVARRVYVHSPTRLQAVVTIRGDAGPGPYTVAVTSGLEVVTLPGAFHVVEPGPESGRRPRARFGSLVNSATFTPDLSPGVLASLYGANLLAGDAAEGVLPRVTFNSQEAQLLTVLPNQVNLVVPFSIEPGTALLEVHNGVAASGPLLVEIAPVSPGLFRVVHADGRPVDAENPAQAGEELVLLATGLGRLDLNNAPPPGGESIQVAVNEQRLPPLSVTGFEEIPGLYGIRFQAPPADAPTSLAVSIRVRGRRSNTLSVDLKP